MTLPFTLEQFLRVFADYHRAVWPALAVLYGLGVGMAVLAYTGRPGAARGVALGLAFLWAWMGGVYHIGFFRAINPAATAFGVAFLGQAVLLLLWSARPAERQVGAVRGAQAWLGGVVLAYALLAYPLIGWAVGHRYPASATFGLPCPTTIATLGLLIWGRPAAPWWVFPVPLLWGVVGGSAAFSLGMWEDLGLLGAGLATLAWLWRLRTRRESIMSAKRHFSAPEARTIGARLGIDWRKIDLEQFRRGLEVELEHGAREPQTNVTNDDLDLTAKIAWAHLKEIRDYYTRLDAMETAAL
jgi:uncharacterized protein DUF6064/uncharacterized protein DUF5661